ncbi:MAG: hypothetical protein GWP14_10240 [Actinobacteria bacterium]|nr:hypothetical protein [Actinomycetota bacterium]
MGIHRATSLLCLFTLIAPTGCRSKQGTPPVAVTVANTYLECVAKDLLGEDYQPIVLAGPGMCPGHYDIRPSQISRLRGCRVLLRFDFQSSLDSKLANLTEGGLKITSVEISGGLCEPTSYRIACKQAAEAFVTAGLIGQAEADRRLEMISARLATLSMKAKKQIRQSGLAGAAVLSSPHQAAFCKWLGLDVVATFSSSDRAGVGEIENAIRAGQISAVRFVIANLPEGKKAADALANRLDATVVVFGNFPDPDIGLPNFDNLVTANVEALLSAARK